MNDPTYSAREVYPTLAWFAWGAEPLKELDRLHAELAALKARRCDGCAHWHVYPQRPSDGVCSAIQSMPSTVADFACNAWTTKETSS